MNWKLFITVILCLTSLLLISMKSIKEQRRTHLLISRNAFLVGCLQKGNDIKDCEKESDLYLKRNWK